MPNKLPSRIFIETDNLSEKVVNVNKIFNYKEVNNYIEFRELNLSSRINTVASWFSSNVEINDIIYIFGDNSKYILQLNTKTDSINILDNGVELNINKIYTYNNKHYIFATDVSGYMNIYTYSNNTYELILNTGKTIVAHNIIDNNLILIAANPDNASTTIGIFDLVTNTLTYTSQILNYIDYDIIVGREGHIYVISKIPEADNNYHVFDTNFNLIYNVPLGLSNSETINCCSISEDGNIVAYVSSATNPGILTIDHDQFRIKTLTNNTGENLDNIPITDGTLVMSSNNKMYALAPGPDIFNILEIDIYYGVMNLYKSGVQVFGNNITRSYNGKLYNLSSFNSTILLTTINQILPNKLNTYLLNSKFNCN
jgi:hypothetical protein